MSNDVMNAHILFGSPCGEDADFMEVADWAGGLLIDLLLEHREEVTAMMRKRGDLANFEKVERKNG